MSEFTPEQIERWQADTQRMREVLFGDIKYKKHHEEHRKHSERLSAAAKEEGLAKFAAETFQEPKPVTTRSVKDKVRKIVNSILDVGSKFF
jgi:hypothetical protein